MAQYEKKMTLNDVGVLKMMTGFMERFADAYKNEDAQFWHNIGLESDTIMDQILQNDHLRVSDGNGGFILTDAGMEYVIDFNSRIYNKLTERRAQTRAEDEAIEMDQDGNPIPRRQYHGHALENSVLDYLLYASEQFSMGRVIHNSPQETVPSKLFHSMAVNLKYFSNAHELDLAEQAMTKLPVFRIGVDALESQKQADNIAFTKKDIEDLKFQQEQLRERQEADNRAEQEENSQDKVDAPDQGGYVNINAIEEEEEEDVYGIQNLDGEIGARQERIRSLEEERLETDQTALIDAEQLIRKENDHESMTFVFGDNIERFTGGLSSLTQTMRTDIQKRGGEEAKESLDTVNPNQIQNNVYNIRLNRTARYNEARKKTRTAKMWESDRYRKIQQQRSDIARSMNVPQDQVPDPLGNRTTIDENKPLNKDQRNALKERYNKAYEDAKLIAGNAKPGQPIYDPNAPENHTLGKDQGLAKEQQVLKHMNRNKARNKDVLTAEKAIDNKWKNDARRDLKAVNTDKLALEWRKQELKALKALTTTKVLLNNDSLGTISVPRGENINAYNQLTTFQRSMRELMKNVNTPKANGDPDSPEYTAMRDALRDVMNLRVNRDNPDQIRGKINRLRDTAQTYLNERNGFFSFMRHAEGKQRIRYARSLHQMAENMLNNYNNGLARDARNAEAFQFLEETFPKLDLKGVSDLNYDKLTVAQADKAYEQAITQFKKVERVMTQKGLINNDHFIDIQLHIERMESARSNLINSTKFLQPTDPLNKISDRVLTKFHEQTVEVTSKVPTKRGSYTYSNKSRSLGGGSYMHNRLNAMATGVGMGISEEGPTGVNTTSLKALQEKMIQKHNDLKDPYQTATDPERKVQRTREREEREREEHKREQQLRRRNEDHEAADAYREQTGHQADTSAVVTNNRPVLPSL
ncbi:MAG: hypothetical protein IJT34_04510 [Butyrivibrio sp.]|nr:hypothetical protein [Butyrivibrio sp.]